MSLGRKARAMSERMSEGSAKGKAAEKAGAASALCGQEIMAEVARGERHKLSDSECQVSSSRRLTDHVPCRGVCT